MKVIAPILLSASLLLLSPSPTCSAPMLNRAWNLVPSNPFGIPITAAQNWWSKPKPNPSGSTDPTQDQGVPITQQNVDVQIDSQQIPKLDNPPVQIQQAPVKKVQAPKKKFLGPVKQSMELFGHRIFKAKAENINGPQTFEDPLSLSQSNVELCNPQPFNALKFTEQGMEAYRLATVAFRLAFVSSDRLQATISHLETAKLSFMDSDSIMSKRSKSQKGEMDISVTNQKYYKKIITMEGWISRVNSLHGAIGSVANGVSGIANRVRKAFTWKKAKVDVKDQEEEGALKKQVGQEELLVSQDQQLVKGQIKACQLQKKDN